MKKVDLLRKVVSAASSTYTQAEVEEILNAFSEVVVNTLKKSNEKISLGEIGAFSVKHVDERRGTSALNGKEWVKPAHDELVFKVAKKYRDM